MDAPRIDLAKSPDFELGGVQVSPARRQVRKDGDSRDLEPKVAKVLVALASDRPSVVSRDRLIQQCWDGQIVGDDALNRCIVSLRHLARQFSPEPFKIETVARVGYSLVELPGKGDTGTPSAASLEALTVPEPLISEPTPPLRVRKSKNAHVIVAVAAILLLAIAVAVGQAWLTKNSTVRVAIVDSREDATSALAKDFGADLMRLAGARADEMVLTMNPKEANFVVRVSLGREGSRAFGNVAIIDGDGGEVLWSGLVEVPQQQLPDIRPQIAAKLGNVLFCAIQSRDTAAQLDAGTVRLYLAACERVELPDEHLVGLLRKVTEHAPGFAEGWANLAVAEAQLHTRSLENPGSVAANDLASLARSHLFRAREIDPQLGAIYVAEAELLPPNRFAQRIAVLEAGIAADPDHAPLHERLSLALFGVGRTTGAIMAAERATALNPLSPASREALIASLAHAGNLPKARRALADAERIWPASAHIMNAKFSLELRYGDAKKAQELIDRGDASLGGSSPFSRGPKIVMAARLDPSPENVARLVRFAAYEAKGVPEAAALRLQSLGQFGAVEEAYQVVDQPGVVKQLSMATDVLFRPHLREFRYDRRFPRIAARLGLMQYWQSSNLWPDFCRDPHLPYDCLAEARRVGGQL